MGVVGATDLAVLVTFQFVAAALVATSGSGLLVEILPPGFVSGWSPIAATMLGLLMAGAYGTSEAWASHTVIWRGVTLGMMLTMWRSLAESGILWGIVHFVTAVASVGILMSIARWLLSLIVFRYRVAVRPGDRVILVGNPDSEAGRKAQAIASNRPEMECIGWLAEKGDVQDYLGHPSAVWEILCDTGTDTVLLCGDLQPGLFDPVVEAAAVAGCRVLSVPTHRTLTATQPRPFREAGWQLLELTFPAARAGQNAMKRAIDVVGSLALILALAPLMALIALWIKIDSKGPVFFVQDRVGQAGRVFPMLKFRTMTDGADEKKEELMHLNESGDPRLFKIANDPRITDAGEILRRWSLDELPQLFNVLQGTMSLVGPRPFFESDLGDYDDHHFVRLTVKPGMTGLWQVRGRSTIVNFEEVVELDRQYIQNWTLALDVRILLGTLPAVLRRTGAF